MNEKIEHIGNKVPFEKKLNIVASNGYFGKKQKEYAQSTIAVTETLASKDPSTWELADIDERDVRVTDTILETLKKWCSEYDASDNSASPQISEEDVELVRALKEKYGESILGI